MSSYFKVLLIDNDEISNFLNQSLIKQLGIVEDIRTYTDPCEALAYLEITPTQVNTQEIIFLDLHMPGMDGLEFLEQFKTLNRENAAVVLLTAAEHRKYALSAARFGVEYYMVKPLTIDKLTKMLERCFGITTQLQRSNPYLTDL